MYSSISVIVPIYQSEATLRRCLDSILSQTFFDIEVLLVDDGSTDKSADICEEYAQKDSRIRTFHKAHSGVSDTRQVGLENASGEYVIHCDSDDWMEPTMLEVLYKKAKETDTDMVVCDFFRDREDGFVIQREFPKGLKADKPIAKQIKTLSYALWNKLVRRSLFDKYNISFPKGVLMAEDVYVTLMLLNYSVTVQCVPQVLYHYDNTSISPHVSRNLTKEAILSNVQVIGLLENSLDISLKNKLNSNKKKVLLDEVRLGLLERSELKKLYPELKISMLWFSMKSALGKIRLIYGRN